MTKTKYNNNNSVIKEYRLYQVGKYLKVTSLMGSWLTWKMSLVSLSLRNIFLQQNNTYYFSCVCTLILDSCESNFEFPLIWIVLKHFTINKIESHLGIQKSICNIYYIYINRFSSEIQLNRKSNIIQGSFRRR